MLDLYKEFLSIVTALEKAKIDYALCGGIAVALYGYPRFTKDIDLLILPEDLDKVLTTIKPLGYSIPGGRIPFDMGESTEREIFRISKVQDDELFTLDLMLVNELFRDVWNNREIFEWEGHHVQVVSRSGLIWMKQLANRNRDRIDIQELNNDE